MMYHIINIFLEVIKSNNFIFNVNIRIFEEIQNHDIVIINLYLDFGNSGSFIELVFRDQGSSDSVQILFVKHGDHVVIRKYYVKFSFACSEKLTKKSHIKAV